ncbi:peroxisomal membrane protein PEX14 [Vitis riparia]|uniref:peroxisomal membrane protein PEX14 n=1 Tax=Vitis riparia TaxID=96939 RepID=UPI00155A4F1F|nr:peroxisomal membrane protein PEX14 [Vitis riparia]
MATQSTPPPDSTTEKPQTPASEVVQPRNEDQQDAKAAATISPPSVFVNSEPMREEQVQNAVKFLSHPKVRGSPVIYRRSFLEKKGLTKEEIDEAFRRVPDQSPTVTGVQAVSANQDGQLKSSNIQQQAQAQTLHPSAATPAGVISKTGTQYRFHWSHAFLAIGFLAASGAGTAILFKNAFIPRLKSWIRKIVLEGENDIVQKSNSKPSLAEEATAAAKAAAAAAADVAKTSQEILTSKIEENRRLEEFMNLLNVQVQEMKSMSNAIRKLEGPNNSTGRLIQQEDTRGLMTTSKHLNVNGKAEFDSRSVRSSSPPASSEPSVAPHPKSYMEIMAMVQRGEKPPNIRDINDLPPNPNQPLSNPRLAPRTKPWEVGQVQYSAGHAYQSQVTGEGFNSRAQDNGVGYQLNGDSSTWWQQKNARITEIETEDEPRTASYTASNEQPIQRTWVPPQPPPIAMPEAAAAIRQPKSSIQRESLVNDQSVSRPSDEIDELQRITKISESGGVVEIKEESSGLNSSEMQQEQE